MRWTPGQIAEAELRWVVVLQLGGEIYRYATRLLEVSDALSGATWRFRPGLSAPDYLDEIAGPGEGVTGDPSSLIELLLGRGESWVDIAAGVDLGDATAELSLVRVGEDWQDRLVVLSGAVVGVEAGGVHEPIRLALSGAPWRRAPKFIPQESHRVTSATWERASYQRGDGMSGQYYPEVVGAPGYTDGANSYPSAPALLVEIETATTNNSANPAIVLLGVGALRCVGVSNSVRLFNLTSGANATVTPSLTTDGLGQSVTIASVAVGTLAIADGDELWAAYLVPSTGGRADTRGQALRGVDEVVRWLVERSGARADLGALTTDLRWARGWALDFWLNEPVDPVDILLDQVLPLLPAAVRVGPTGLEVIRWPLEAVAADAVAHLDLTHTPGRRLGPVTRTDPGEVYSTHRIAYAVHGPEGAPLRGHVYADRRRATEEIDSGFEVHPAARAAASRYGQQEAPELESALIMDRQTATAVLGWRALWHHRVRERATYALDQRWQALDPGEVVTVTDPEIGWSARLCVVVGVLRREGPTELTLETLPAL